MKTNVCECPDRVAVTGVLGYSGRYMARKLAERGARFVGLTNSPESPIRMAGGWPPCAGMIPALWRRACGDAAP